MKSVRVLIVLAASVAVLATSSAGRAAEGASTVTPNMLTFLISKDIGVERWVVSLNLSPSDPSVVANVTGNVFKSDGSPPAFVVCRPRDDSTGTLSDAGSTFRFVCDGADACSTTARECARSGWQRIAEDVQLSAQFFLPSGGLTASAARNRGLGELVERLASAWSRLTGSAVRQGAELLLPRSASAQASNRGATLTSDGLTYLVNKDLANERYSIGLNYLPVTTSSGGVVNRIEGVTGNVLRGESAPPAFIYCTVRDDSTGTLDDPSSTFRLACVGADGCASTAEQCARDGWTPISDDVAIPASFFLPPAGLPATPQSDPEIVIIGRTSDPPSYETSDFTTVAGGASAAGTAAACRVGGPCLANRVGSCTKVPGTLVGSDDSCRCRIDEIDPQCVACGGGATGQCGTDCEFALGDATVRGTCLPEASSNAECICYGIGAGSTLAVEQCSGPLEAGCPAQHCCTDDPRDGCDQGPAACPGVCVTGTCPEDAESCGICFATGGGGPTPRPTPRPTASPRETDEPTPAVTSSPKPTSTPKPTATPKPTSTPKPTATPKPTGTPKPTATPKPTSSPKPSASPTPDATPSPGPTPAVTASPTPAATASPSPTPAPTASPTPSPQPTASPTPTPPLTCTNGIADGGESDIDCGGPCPGCPLYGECQANADCAAGLFCVDPINVCGTGPTFGCSDGLIDNGETDVDCGGTQCPHTCTEGDSCTSDNDCVPGLFCAGMFPSFCATP